MRNAAHMRYAEYLGTDVTDNAQWNMHVITAHTPYPYPAITKSGHHLIHGEVYRVSEENLRALDLFELAVPNTANQEYVRKSIPLKEYGKAYAYIGLDSLVKNTSTCHDFIKEERGMLFWDERLQT